MRFIISYDIENDKQRTKIAKTLSGFGERIQYSVFEFNIDPGRRVELMALLEQRNLVPAQGSGDSIVLFPMCEACYAKRERRGKSRLLDENVLVF